VTPEKRDLKKMKVKKGKELRGNKDKRCSEKEERKRLFNFSIKGK